MMSLRKIVILFAFIALLSPTLASAMVGGDEMPDCELKPDPCTELIIQQDEQIAALEAQLEEAGMTPVPKLSSAPEPTPEPVAATGDWSFVEDYTQQMMDAAAWMCDDAEVYSEMIGLSDPTVFNDQSTWHEYFETNKADKFFALQQEFGLRLDAEIAANGGVTPNEVPSEPYTVLETINLLGESGNMNCSGLYFYAEQAM